MYKNKLAEKGERSLATETFQRDKGNKKHKVWQVPGSAWWYNKR